MPAAPPSSDQSLLLKEHRLLRFNAILVVANGDSDNMLAVWPAKLTLPLDLERAHHAGHGALEPLVNVNFQVRVI